MRYSKCFKIEIVQNEWITYGEFIPDVIGLEVSQK